MATIDYGQRIIHAKVVYYGPHGSGKTTNLNHIWEKTKTPGAEKQRLKGDRADSEYYDYLPLSLGEIRGFKTQFHLFTVPGHPSYSASRAELLKGVDGIIFVADSHEDHVRDNTDSLAELETNLAA